MPLSRSGDAPRMERRLLRDEAHSKIRDAILAGDLAPGEVLDDKELQDWMGVSRTPIRDALLRLELEGLVEIRAQSKTTVVQPTPTEVEDSIQVLGALMGGVTRLTIPHLSKEARERITALCDIALESITQQDERGHLEAALSIYNALLDSCPNEMLTNLTRAAIVPLTFRYRAVLDVRTPNWKLLEAGWQGVRDGLKTGDNVRAELALEEMHRLPLPGSQWEEATWRTVPSADDA